MDRDKDKSHDGADPAGAAGPSNKRRGSVSWLDVKLANSQEGGAHEGCAGGGGAELELTLSEDSALPTRSHPCPAPWAAHQHFAGARTVTGRMAWHQRMVLPLRTGLGVGQAEECHEGTLC